MKTARALSLLFAAAALFLAGCATVVKENLKPTGSVAVTFDGVKKKLNAILRQSEEIVVTLPAKPAPGAEWRIIFKDARLLLQTGETKPVPGTSGATTMTFFARAPGRTTIQFGSVRGNGAIEPVTDTCELVVNIRPPPPMAVPEGPPKVK